MQIAHRTQVYGITEMHLFIMSVVHIIFLKHNLRFDSIYISFTLINLPYKHFLHTTAGIEVAQNLRCDSVTTKSTGKVIL